MNTVLEIRDLVVRLGKSADAPHIIDGVSLQLGESETLCVVGESGSGKSVTALTVMGLLQRARWCPPGAASSWWAKSF